MVDASATGIPVMVVSHRHPVVRGLAPPLVTLCHWPGESPRTGVRMGLLLCHDVGLCLLTSVGPRLPHWFPPRWCSLNCRSSSLPERGSLTVMRAPSSRGRTEARAGHDAIRAHTDAIRHHYHTQVSTSNSQSDWCIALHRSLNERAAHLGLQEMEPGGA
jgi:hypothetical protein